MWTATPPLWTVRWGPLHRAYGDPFAGVATLIRAGDQGFVSVPAALR